MGFGGLVCVMVVLLPATSLSNEAVCHVSQLLHSHRVQQLCLVLVFFSSFTEMLQRLHQFHENSERTANEPTHILYQVS